MLHEGVKAKRLSKTALSARAGVGCVCVCSLPADRFSSSEFACAEAVSDAVRTLSAKLGDGHGTSPSRRTPDEVLLVNAKGSYQHFIGGRTYLPGVV